MFAVRAALLGLAVLCAMPSRAASVRSDTPVEPLPAAIADVQQAVRAVWKNSPSVQAARAELDAAQAAARAAAKPIYNPTVSLEAENADVDRRTAGVGLTLDLSGKRAARGALGDAQMREAQARYDLLRQDIAGRWLKAWSASALAARRVETGRRRLALMQQFDALAAQRLKVGDISSPERDLVSLALGEAQIQQAALIGDEAGERARLASIVNEGALRVPSLPEPLPPAAATVIALPLEQRLPFVEALARQASSDAGVRVAQRARIPDPTVSLAGGRVRTGNVTDQVIGISVSLPLPVLNDGRADIDAARAQADAAAAAVNAARLNADAALQEQRTRYEALREAAQAFRAGRAAAFDERAALLQRLWNAGEISTSDYLLQLKQSLDTALSGLELESRAWDAWFDYLATAGRLTDWVDGHAKDASP